MKRLPMYTGDEFPKNAFELDGTSRRSFLKLMGASMALASLDGCRRPADVIVPYGQAPESIVPGRPLHYASAFAFGGTALGVLVESHEGRPTKIEGNPQHPESRGGAHAFAQASVLDLYDPDRSRNPQEGTARRDWAAATAFLKAEADRLGDGHALAVVTEAHRSPSIAAQLAALARKFPKARIVRYEPLGRVESRRGAELAFGRPLDAVLQVDKARVIATLDCDLLSSVRHAHAFAEGRRHPLEGMNRLYAIESAFSLTGASADHRLRARSRRVHAIALGLAQQLGVTGLPAGPSLDANETRFIAALAKDLKKQNGLVVVGETQPAAVHAIVALINAAIGSEAVTYVAPFTSDAEGPAALVALAQAMKRGEIETALLLGGNPVYDAPADADFAAALKGVRTSIHLSSHVDETSSVATWHLNRAHWLESWSDVRAEEGTWSIVQPLIAPLFDGRTEAEVLELFLGGTRTGHDLATATLPTGTDVRQTLHDGHALSTAWQSEKVTPQPNASALGAPADDGGPNGGIEVTFRPDAHAYDGRFANNGWMQELPDPMTKLTWDNAALVSPKTAAKLGLTDGDVVELRVDGRVLRIPVLSAPGQADDSVALAIGQGRRTGSVAKGVGFDVNVVRQSTAFGIAQATLTRTGEKHTFAVTHGHHSMEGRPIVREATLEEAHKEPEFARKPDEEHPPLKSLWKEKTYDAHKWGMVIDLETCTGCNACTIACQAENNIPLVGKTGVLRSREMHWIRVDRYFTDGDDPQSYSQPIGCQQCENAPCEQVCPVGATTHSPEGLNDMAYNRCIGTRYCANNCPYKVRRFNFFNYNNKYDEIRKMQFNPDVTVRSRGVMEKCTYCVQRINGAKAAAHAQGRDRVREGEVMSACQQTCPTKAITFGDLNDPTSAVAQRVKDDRNYVLLEELNVKPRTSFLARVRNPNPELG